MVNTKISKNKSQRFTAGFTLIEIMVAVSIFSIVMVIAIGAVLSIVSANKKAQALNSVITNLNFALEGMMRDLRTGYDYDCIPTSTGLDNCTGGINDPAGHSIKFASSQADADVIYGLDSGGFILKQTGNQITNGESFPLTAPEVTITKLDFYVDGTVHGGDNRQPKILIVISGKFNGFVDAKFSLQTFVSQRKLDL